jgi:PAS domain S-box-containing protein
MPSAARSEPLLQITLLGEAVEHAPVGVFVFDERGEYVAVNLHGCELLGHSRDAILGSRIGAFAAEPEEALRSYRAVADGASEGTTRVRRGDGSVVELRFRARETSIGGVMFYIGIAWTVEGGAAGETVPPA